MAKIKNSLWTEPLNWNVREFAITYSNDGFYFKISRINEFGKNQMTLKQIARLAVLTSFSEEFLIQQNLPKSLFDYLGINR